MSKFEEDCRYMIHSFQLSDFQSLLEAFNLNSAGRKTDLKQRVIEILKKKSPVNYQAFVSKIIEINNFKITNGASQNNMQNQRQQVMPVGMHQAQSSRLYQQPPQNHQSIPIPQAGPSQFMPKMQRNIYGSNQIQNSSGSAGPHLIVPQVPINSQLNTVSTNFLTVNTHANSFIPSAQSLAKIKLRKLPFYEIVSEIIKPSTLVGHVKCSLPNPPKGMREELFKFVLSPEQATIIAMNRDISNGKNYYLYQLQIRICLFEPGSIETTDFLPLSLFIRVGNFFCQLPPSSKPGIESRRVSEPIDCTRLAKLNPSMVNTINVNWTPDAKTYIMGVYLVKNLTSEMLLQQLINKKPRSSKETKNYIIKKLANVDPDLTTTSYRVSLLCPLGKTRMKMPAKSISCKHLQCFDAGTFILMNEKKSTWSCPTCNQPCLYDDIQIESYFLEVVISPNVPDSCEEIELLDDGTWKVCEEIIDPVETKADAKENPLDCINLDSDDENVMDAKEEHINYPESSKESEKLKACLIDLTLSDNEEPSEDEQENEAQAANSKRPMVRVDLKPYAPLVQTQQAVTGSKQNMIIEIDSSPSPPSSPTTIA